jgi:hypothetical protein
MVAAPHVNPMKDLKTRMTAPFDADVFPDEPPPRLLLDGACGL